MCTNWSGSRRPRAVNHLRTLKSKGMTICLSEASLECNHRHHACPLAQNKWGILITRRMILKQKLKFSSSIANNRIWNWVMTTLLSCITQSRWILLILISLFLLLRQLIRSLRTLKTSERKNKICLSYSRRKVFKIGWSVFFPKTLVFKPNSFSRAPSQFRP